MRSRTFIAVLVIPLAALASVAEAAPYLVRGQVVTARGALAGATVRLVPPPRTGVWPGDEPEHHPPEPVEAESGADGRFELAIQKPPGDLEGIDARHTGWLLEIAAPGLTRRILELPAPSRSGGGAALELGGILLAPGITVRGRVVQRDATATAATGETPLAGARVALWRAAGGTPRPWTATTGDDGGFRIADVPPGDYGAVVDSPGFAPHTRSQLKVLRSPRGDQAESPVGDRSTDLGTIVLRPALPLSGRVVDAEGKPLAGVRVRFRHRLPPGARDWLPAREAATDASGTFQLAEMPPEPDLLYGFRFDLRGYRWRGTGFEIEPTGGGLRLAGPVTLEPAWVLAGRVTDPSGEPIAGARVTPFKGDRIPEGASTHSTDAGGRFRIDHLAAPIGGVEILARGFVGAKVEIEPRRSLDAAALDAVEPAAIVLEPAETTDLTIAVRDAQGRPVDSAEINFGCHRDLASAYHEMAVTGDAGSHLLDRVPVGGPCSLSVRHPEHPKWWRSDLVVAAGQRVLVVDLDPAPWSLETVRGRVVDDAGGAVPGAEVSLALPLRGAQYQARADGDGRFELRRVKEGAYRLTASAPGWATAELPVSVTADLAELEVTLEAGAVLRGTIGGVKPGEVDELGLRVYAQKDPEIREAILGGDRYRIDHLGVGRWTVNAYAQGSHISSELEIEPGQTEARLDFELPAGHRLSGRLLIDGQPPPAGHGIYLQTAQEALVHGYHDARFDGGGRFVFDHVAAGPYRLSYHSEAGSILRRMPVEADVELFFDVHTVPLRGRAVDAATGDGVAGVTIQAFPEIHRSHGPRWETVSEPSGWFELGRVLPGPWTLIVKAPGFLEHRLTVTAGATTEPPILELVASEGLHVRVETSAALPYSVELELRGPDGERAARGHVPLAGVAEGHWSEAPRGRYRLRASNKLTWIETDVEIPGPVVPLRFPPAGALRLTVPDLEPAPEAPWRPALPIQVEATLELPDDPAFDGPRRRRSRFLRLKSLTPGLWRIEVRAEDGRTWTASALVVDGRTSEVILGSR